MTAARAAMVASVESGRQFNGEYRVVRPDGEIHVVQVRAQPTFGSSGKALGLRGIGQDVTPTGPSLGLGVKVHPHVGEDAQHEHGGRRDGEVPDVEDLLPRDHQAPIGDAHRR